MRSALLLVLALALTACGGPEADTARSRLGACGTTPAPSLFDHALCLCGDFLDVGMARVGPGHDPASLAVDGRSESVSMTVVDGDFIPYGGLRATADLAVNGNLESSADVQWVGKLGVRGDVDVGGDFTGVGDLEVEGNVAVAGERFTLGRERVGGVDRYLASAGPPCDCDPSTFLDVPALVSLARTDNDNAARGFEAGDVLSVGDLSMYLETGRYYFEDALTIGRAHLTIAGAVSLYLDGNVASVGDGRIEILPGASLDLYVAGSVATVGRIDLGDRSDPSRFRLYIGGDRPVQIGVGLTEIAGSIYAPQAEIVWVGDTRIEGAVFANDLGGVGRLDVRYTRPVAVDVPPDECPEPADPPPAGGNGGNGNNGGGPAGGQPDI